MGQKHLGRRVDVPNPSDSRMLVRSIIALKVLTST